MNLEPSKLSKQADQVWNESTRLFQAKKAAPGSIGFGFSKFAATKTGGETNANGGDEREQSAMPGGVVTAATQLPTSSNISSGADSGGSLPGGYVFGLRLADRVVKKVDDGGDEQLKPEEQSCGGRPKDVSSIFGSFKRCTADGEAVNVASLWKVQGSKSKSHNPAQSDSGNTTTVLSTLHLDPPASASNSNSLQASIEAMEKKQQRSSGVVVGGSGGGMSEPITTGEEEERNLLNINCKFYHFNRESKSWVERGLGTLRVNQRRGAGNGAVRVIGRSAGNQKILINSKIWSEMILEEVSEKRLKISAQNSDSPIPQLFIIQANPSNLVNLYALLEKHIALAHEFTSSKSSRKRKASKKTPANDCEEDEAHGLERVEEDEEPDSSEEVHSKRPEVEGDEENGSSDE